MCSEYSQRAEGKKKKKKKKTERMGKKLVHARATDTEEDIAAAVRESGELGHVGQAGGQAGRLVRSSSSSSSSPVSLLRLGQIYMIDVLQLRWCLASVRLLKPVLGR